MSAYATGGKVWIIPNASAPTGNIHTLKSFLHGTLCFYILLTGAFTSVIAIATIVNLLTPNVDNYVNFMTADGGIQLTASSVIPSTIEIKPALIALLLLPIVLNLGLMGMSITLSKIKSIKNDTAILYCFIVAAVIFLILAAAFVNSQYNFFQPTTATKDDVYMWIMERYSILPEELPSLESMISGQEIHLYGDNQNITDTGIHLQKVNDAYYLFNAEGKELQLASNK